MEIAMPILPVQYQQSQMGQINFPDETTPYSALWWTSQTITDIPADAIGWLVAQGWSITNIAYDQTTVPWTPYYALQRNSLQNWYILQDLLNKWTVAYNDARWANSLRYNQTIVAWADLLTSTQWQFNQQVQVQNVHVALYLGNLDAYMTAIEGFVTANNATIDAAVAQAVATLPEAQALMDAHGPVYDALVDSLLTDYLLHEADFSAVLNLLPTDYDVYSAAFTGVLDLLPTDYDTHATTATNYLLDLGATELARINEHFAATLAEQLQQLVDRGLSTATLIADITERNERDRDEQIQALNDRLMREKWENQHRIYEQQQSVRDRTLSGKDRLYGQQTEMRGRMLEGKERLYDRKQSMRDRTLAGKDRLYSLKQELVRYRIAQILENAEAELRHKHQAIAELMTVYNARLNGEQTTHELNQRLMAYQLDERNKALVGLFGFVERREDVGPSIDDMARICTSLGDAGGGWISP
jgi:hypothetical protein